MHKIDFSVPLSGSQLFDYHAYATAQNLCGKYPLSFELDSANKRIHIYGELNDTWYDQWVQEVFAKIGEHD